VIDPCRIYKNDTPCVKAVDSLAMSVAGIVFMFGMRDFPNNLYHALLIASFIGTIKGMQYFLPKRRFIRFFILFLSSTMLPIQWVVIGFGLIYPNPKIIASYDVVLGYAAAVNLLFLWAYSSLIFILEITALFGTKKTKHK
jgi:hypothetical protein